METLCPENWLEQHSDSSHPAVELWISCKNLIDRKKANKQIKTTEKVGYGIVANNLTDKLPDIMNPSEDIPDQLLEYINAANSQIGKDNSSVSVVVLFWAEVNVLGNLETGDRLLLVAKTKSVVLAHRNPLRAVGYDLGTLKVERQVQESLRKDE